VIISLSASGGTNCSTLPLCYDPKWIHNNAVINGPHALYPQFFEILPTTGEIYQRALQVQLIAPNILTSTDSITVTITAAVDTNLADATNHNHDIIFGISDGASFIGFNKDNYPHTSPCYKFEGDFGQNILKNIKQGNGLLVTS